ncbi:MAG: Asp-tRNA(Asn)/Glu-tRNA(Gln) amidotransferase subunit GatC [Helicobacteraceae bacterium]|jgi:aspartyl-tRNA(Asn)/glutamyl-tRNA(Gln) amidotransferase subunit C|nr:Asp-tRNA(Asn)/Glu-tRNA(Gln) amidotransferase subunit GatC [Helicobacteraceae bacterium]
MTIDDELLNRLETLSRLTIAPNKREAAKRSLSEILDFVEKLNELDTSRIDAISTLFNARARLRADEPKEDRSVFEDLIARAPKSDGQSFITPRVVG